MCATWERHARHRLVQTQTCRLSARSDNPFPSEAAKLTFDIKEDHFKWANPSLRRPLIHTAEQFPPNQLQDSGRFSFHFLCSGQTGCLKSRAEFTYSDTFREKVLRLGISQSECSEKTEVSNSNVPQMNLITSCPVSTSQIM